MSSRIFLFMLAVFTAGLSTVVHANGKIEQVSAQRWQVHVEQELLPWWRQKEALGQPVGRFPTHRCADGRAWQPARPCAELQTAPAWIRSELGRQYVRMQSRQVFAYAIGFHMTGDVQLLRWAQAGVSDIRRRALDRATGSPASWYAKDGTPEPAVGERTAQDIAYAGLSLAVMYYLTADAGLLQDMQRLHQHLMSYWQPDTGQLRWTLTGPDSGRQELVAQLDPLNAYMVLVTPLLRGEQQQRWQADMRRLAVAIRDQYCAGDGPYCAGTLGQPDSRLPGGRHNDFGHTGKALWMLLLVARQLQDPALENWARPRAQTLLEKAWIADKGIWASRWTEDGVESGNSWWIWAELDQLASTLALEDAQAASYLQRSWPFWLQHYVDHRYGEVWGWVTASGQVRSALKQHQWKNGYHSLEHALISYLASSALQGEPATLYFAAGAARHARLRPYLLPGEEVSRSARGPLVLQVGFRLPRPAQPAGAAPTKVPAVSTH